MAQPSEFQRVESNPKFHKKMMILLIALLVGYLGIKTWHISIALRVYADEPLQISTQGAAK